MTNPRGISGEAPVGGTRAGRQLSGRDAYRIDAEAVSRLFPKFGGEAALLLPLLCLWRRRAASGGA
jgi:hypothetical protein